MIELDRVADAGLPGRQVAPQGEYRGLLAETDHAWCGQDPHIAGPERERWKAEARTAGEAIADPEDREHFDEDFATL